jgi:hypothetical protein
MKRTFWLGAAAAAALGVSILCATDADASTYDVLKVKMTMTGVTQDDENGVPVIGDVKVSTRKIINFARGRNPSSPIPANEVLAVAVECQSVELKLIVYDLNTSSNLVTIATWESGGIAMVGRKGEFVGLSGFRSTGDGAFRIDGGYLSVAGTFAVNSQGCVKTMTSSNMNGVIVVTGQDNVGPYQAVVLVKSGVLETLGKIGTLIEDSSP